MLSRILHQSAETLLTSLSVREKSLVYSKSWFIQHQSFLLMFQGWPPFVGVVAARLENVFLAEYQLRLKIAISFLSSQDS